MILRKLQRAECEISFYVSWKKCGFLKISLRKIAKKTKNSRDYDRQEIKSKSHINYVKVLLKNWSLI